MASHRVRTLACTASALIAFAANSLLCRQALGHGAIDAASFSTIRIASGAATLVLLAATRRAKPGSRGSWGSAAWLFLYAVPFSFAYVSLGAATGALVLFGAVQATMLAAAVLGGERPSVWQWLGLALALSGLVYLVTPGLAAPSPIGCTLMATAGFSWGIYSLRGRGQADPLSENAGNFVRAVPLAVGVSVFTWTQVDVHVEGALLAVVSGAVTSGLGYVIWYAALAGLTATQAAGVQLAVPVLAALGGVAFLDERITIRLIVAGLSILGGVALSIVRTERRRRQPLRPEGPRSREPEAGS